MAIGFFIGAGVMAIGGIAELLFGVKAEQKPARGHRRAADRHRLGFRRGLGPEEAAGAPPRRPTARRRIRTSPGMPVSEPAFAVGVEHEVEIIDRALRESGGAGRRELRRAVGASRWGRGASTRRCMRRC